MSVDDYDTTSITSLSLDKVYEVDITTTTNSVALNTPKQVKGGTFAPADISLIKAALSVYAAQDISEAEQRQIVNLMHRLSNRV